MSGKTDLSQIYDKQLSFQNRLKAGTIILPADNLDEFKYHVTAMTEEMGELVSSDKRWKSHRNRVYSESGKLSELADVFITAINLGIYSGFTSDQVIEAINEKIVKNHKRLDKENNSGVDL